MPDYLSDDIGEPTGYTMDNSVPVSFNAPEFYSPDYNFVPGGYTDSNQTPVGNVAPVSSPNSVGDLFGRALDASYLKEFILGVGKSKFGNTVKPSSNQGGTTQVFVTNPNPDPYSQLFNLFAKPAESNPDLPGPFSQIGLFAIGAIVLVVLFLFARR